MIKNLTLGLILFGATLAQAETYDVRGAWGPRELLAASKASVIAFQQKHGTAIFQTIVGISVTRTSQGNSAKAKIAFVYQGATRLEQFFCHVHDGREIDCH